MRVVRRLKRRKRRQKQPAASSRGRSIALRSFASAKPSLRRRFLKDSVSSTSSATRDHSIALIRSSTTCSLRMKTSLGSRRRNQTNSPKISSPLCSTRSLSWSILSRLTLAPSSLLSLLAETTMSSVLAGRAQAASPVSLRTILSALSSLAMLLAGSRASKEWPAPSSEHGDTIRGSCNVIPLNQSDGLTARTNGQLGEDAVAFTSKLFVPHGRKNPLKVEKKPEHRRKTQGKVIVPQPRLNFLFEERGS